MKTADSHNAAQTGRIELDIKSVTPQAPIATGDAVFSMARNKIGFERNAEYLAFVREHACIRCGARGPSDPHHVFGSFGSLKTSDYAVVPLCRPCHEEAERDVLTRRECVVWLVLFLKEQVREEWNV